MGGQQQHKKSKVVKIDSRKSWEHHIFEATNKGYPVMVHFSAYWCVPSIAMDPFFEELASTYQDVLFLKVDVDEVKEVASKLEINAMPTFLLMSGGTPVEKAVGANPDEIRKRMDHFINQTHSSKSL
ncbi:putative monodehydroascorbate reductase (NADH) [Medicago truncatula]|uniref:Putative monodehydroascorbate reductase (NADH) n=1 Tax=Medicago truncatula TaxID=3880 RepID=G7JF34_MEDTR|nr:thioredoxin-like protein CXXS1 [Medicago truncatula]AES89900.1 thioredoxin [Medicago truncatula]RHN61940.1 putative monodehydroascorbate reductase (NADH) [Medicago truncatula]